jgi:hypothetical protein
MLTFSPEPPPLRCRPPKPTPDHAHQVISAELDYKFACSGYDVRAFVVEALDGMNLGGSMAAAKAELLAAVDEAEKASGGDLNGSEKGWQVLASKLGEIEKKYGLADKGKVRDEAIFEMYKQHIHQLRSTVSGAGYRGPASYGGRL